MWVLMSDSRTYDNQEKFERWIEDCPCDYNFLEYGKKLKNRSDLLSGFVEDETVRIYQFYPIGGGETNG